MRSRVEPIMLESLHQPVLSRRRFARRMAILAGAALIVDGLVLAAGAVGYHFLDELDWLDAGVNAALVMTGNGPAHEPRTPGGKVFTIFYALLGVILFACVIGALLIPVFHPMLHILHSSHVHGNEKNERQQAIGCEGSARQRIGGEK